MNLFGVSANLMELRAIDFGLIVDGAVIIVEATLHFFSSEKLQGKLTQKQMDNAVGGSARHDEFGSVRTNYYSHSLFTHTFLTGG